MTSITYVCNGAGAQGSQGPNGPNSLVSITAISPGTQCPNGGDLVQTGVDTNGNGILDTSEVQGSAVVCNGTSTGTCPSPQTSCGSYCADLATDPSNCGTCATKCSVANGTANCLSGSCGLAACNAGFGDCNGLTADGCEANLASDGNNCGSCGDACSTACTGHVAATECSSAACVIVSCAAGFADADQVCSDGCECAASTAPTTCTGAQSLFSGALPIGASITPFSASLAGVQAAFFTLTFTGNTSPSYHPMISLSGSSSLVMDVTQDCSGTAIGGAAACSDNGAAGSKRVRTLEAFFSNDVAPGQDYLQPIPALGSSGQVWIKVYRTATDSTCDTFTITASN